MTKSEHFTDAILSAIECHPTVPRGAKGRVLFQSFLALATAEKGSPLTIAEVTKLCVLETETAFRIGALEK